MEIWRPIVWVGMKSICRFVQANYGHADISFSNAFTVNGNFSFVL